MLRAGLEGIVARGKAEAGDKTMYDALAPALEAFDEALGSGGDVAAAAGPRPSGRGRPRRDRAAARPQGAGELLGERSVGHVDPGAASSTLLLAALADALASEGV